MDYGPEAEPMDYGGDPGLTSYCILIIIRNRY